MRPIYYFSPLIKLIKKYQDVWVQIESALISENECYSFLQNTADIWVRDFMPFQRADGCIVIYQYNPDYLQGKDSKFITKCDAILEGLVYSDGKISSQPLPLPFVYQTNLVIDGGNLIKCKDKHNKDCIILTTKVLYENRGLTHSQIIHELEEVFKAEVILINWDCYEVFGHSDGMVRNIGDGRLLLNCYSDMDSRLGVALKKAFSDRFDLYELNYGKNFRNKSWCHLNYLELTNSILVPVANIPSDSMALKQIEDLTGKKCIPISMDRIVKEGGGMHCISGMLDRGVLSMINEEAAYLKYKVDEMINSAIKGKDQ